jgi:hypothetical protein
MRRQHQSTKNLNNRQPTSLARGREFSRRKTPARRRSELKNRKEQIGGTQQKPQWIVSQGYSRTYNSWMQQSRLQWIYRSRDLSYD